MLHAAPSLSGKGSGRAELQFCYIAAWASYLILYVLLSIIIIDYYVLLFIIMHFDHYLLLFIIYYYLYCVSSSFANDNK